MRETRSGGRPIAVMTIIRVTRPAWGIPAAPILATVAVILKKSITGKVRSFKTYLNHQAPVAQKIANEVVFRRSKGERGEFFLIGPHWPHSNF